MSPMTILATLAFASPTNESGPVWSAIDAYFDGTAPGVGDAVMMSSLEMSVSVARSDDKPASCKDCARPCAPIHREDSPISDTPLRLSEFVATLALAQDNAFGQPLESQLRSCLLATSICEAAGFDEELRETVYWVALLRYIGCTGHAHEVATVFGDEIAIRAQTLVHDAANPAEVMRDIMAFATAGRTLRRRDEIVRMIQETAREWAVYNFSSGCEVADMLVRAARLRPRRS